MKITHISSSCGRYFEPPMPIATRRVVRVSGPTLATAD
jgi:hypothetical protein